MVVVVIVYNSFTDIKQNIFISQHLYSFTKV